MRTKDKHVQADAQGPDVGQSRLIRLPAAHLRGHEGGRPGGSLDEVVDARQLGAAEIRDLDMAICRQQEIVRFEVTMGDLVIMEIAQSLQPFSIMSSSSIL